MRCARTHARAYNACSVLTPLLRLRLRARERRRERGTAGRMRLVGLVSLVAAFIFLLSFRSLLHQQVLVGDGSAVRISGRHDRNQQQHAEQWAEERKRMRWFMTRDYASARRHTPRNNRLDP